MALLSPSMEQSNFSTTRVQPTSHGVLIVNKPAGWTSHDVVKRVRGASGNRKVGHAGTLDPQATGVLPVLIGKGTKIAQYLLGWDKEYAAVLQLGQATDTQDASGTVLEEKSYEALSEADVRSVFMEFQGSIQQVPPMYSAVKVGGQPLYKKARKGQTVERPPKTVQIHDLEIQHMTIPEVRFRVVCSKGTYVRTLCADIGDRLGPGGHLKFLQRRRVGPLHLDQAIVVESLRDGVELSELGRAWWSLDQVLGGFPAVEVNEDDARKVLHGNAIPWNRIKWVSNELGMATLTESRPIRVKSRNGALLALGKGPSMQPGLKGAVLALDTVFV